MRKVLESVSTWTGDEGKPDLAAVGLGPEVSRWGADRRACRRTFWCCSRGRARVAASHPRAYAEGRSPLSVILPHPDAKFSGMSRYYANGVPLYLDASP